MYFLNLHLLNTSATTQAKSKHKAVAKQEAGIKQWLSKKQV
jgi:hypothetical protein